MKKILDFIENRIVIFVNNNLLKFESGSEDLPKSIRRKNQTTIYVVLILAVNPKGIYRPFSMLKNHRAKLKCGCLGWSRVRCLQKMKIKIK